MMRTACGPIDSGAHPAVTAGHALLVCAERSLFAR